MTLWNQEQRAVFHLKKGLWFERLADGSVRMFTSTPLAAYWTHEKGFHDPETEIAIIEKGSWESILAYLEIAHVLTEPSVHGLDLLTPEDAWDDLVNKSDRTSPEEYPDMALITFDELADYMRFALAATEPTTKEVM